jgi:hypothetical protein
MALTNVNSIASLEALNGALSQYRTASDEPFRRFAPIFAEKLDLLAQLEPHFVKKVQNAKQELDYAQRAYYACMDNPDRVSCSFEASMVQHAETKLMQAEENMEQYRSTLSQLKDAIDSYQNAASRYASNLQNISSSIVPNFSGLIAEMRAYSDDGGSAFGGGVAAGNSIGYTGDGAGIAGVAGNFSLSSLQAAAAKAGVVGIADKNSGTSTIDLRGMDDSATPGKSANTNNISMATVGGVVVAGVVVSAVSLGILAHFKKNGIDNDFANKEIHRFLQAKYGAPMGSLSQEEKEQYVKDYNELSKAVEEDVKNKHTEEIDNLRKEENEKRAKAGQISIEEAEQQYEYSTLADHVYNPNQKLPENWSKVPIEGDAASELVKEIKRLNNDGSGFYAELYKNDITGEYTLAFRGTQPPKHMVRDLLKPVTSGIPSILKGEYSDIAADIFQGKQYENAKSLGEKIKELELDKKLELDNFKIVGHSLGGGLATVAGLESRCQTYTYNQAELFNVTTIPNLKLNTEGHEKIITQYLDRNQWLAKGQDFVNNALSEKTMVAINKSEFNFAQRRIEASKKFETDSPDNFFARLGTVKTIDSKGEHGIKAARDFFNTQSQPNLYGNGQLKDFHISEMSDYPKVEDRIHIIQNSTKEVSNNNIGHYPVMPKQPLG